MKSPKTELRFVICIKNEDCEDLELRKIYQVLPDEAAAEDNYLRVIDELLTSTPRFIANKKAYADPWKRQKIDSVALLLRGAIEARAKVGLKLNVARDKLDRVLEILPAELSPTISSLAEEKYVAVEAILEVEVERQIVPQLQRAGRRQHRRSTSRHFRGGPACGHHG